ncbi:MAG: hypothetical protein AAFN12_10430 [Cyanobacteria bacterium J06560_2]
MKTLLDDYRSRAVTILGAATLLGSLVWIGACNKTALSQPASAEIQVSGVSQPQTKTDAVPEIVGFRVLYIFEYGFGGAAYYERVLALFDDGTFTRDFSGLLSGEGVASSRQNNSNRWGEWRIGPENDFTYKYSGQSNWRDDASYSSLPIVEGLRLNDCYTALSTTNAARTYGTYCFSDNGSVTYRIGDRVKRGEYAARSGFIGLAYEDGTTDVNFFGVYSDGLLISMNDLVLTRQNNSD